VPAGFRVKFYDSVGHVWLKNVHPLQCSFHKDTVWLPVQTPALACVCRRTPRSVADQHWQIQTAMALRRLESRGEELLTAARNGDTATVTALLELGAYVRYKDEYHGYGFQVPLKSSCLMKTGLLCSRTALHFASLNGHKEAALALVKVGAEVHCKDFDGYGLMLACDRHAFVLDSLAGLCDRCIPSDGDSRA
jgi:ankyrin repeat protein